MMSRRIILLVLWFALSACVSIQMPQRNEVRKSENVRYTQPGPPFTPFTQGDLDRGWRNPSNGNTISFLTECDSSIDPSLENIQSGMIKGIHSAEVISSKKFHYNGREALRSVIVGDVDGVSSKIDVVILKKNGCNYILTYAGLITTFESDAHTFQKFVEGFVAP